MPIKAQNVFQYFDLKNKSVHQFVIFQTFLSVKQKSQLSHRLLKMCNVYLPVCLLVFKRMGPEDNEIQVFMLVTVCGFWF